MSRTGECYLCIREDGVNVVVRHFVVNFFDVVGDLEVRETRREVWSCDLRVGR